MGQVVDLYSPPEAAPGGILARYRRPLWPPLVASYLAAWSERGDLVLDPFCQDATVIRAAALAGRRAVAVTRNPLLGLLTRVEAAPPAASDLRAALRRVHLAPKVDVALGDHLDHLYDVPCSRCGAPVSADAFVWERDQNQPLLAEYRCPNCAQAAREPVAPGGAAGTAFEAQGFYRRWVAERLRTETSRDRLQERLLDLYTPRNLYALVSLTSRWS